MNPIISSTTEGSPIDLDPDRVVREMAVVVPDSEEDSVSGILEGQTHPDLGIWPVVPPVGDLV